MLVLSSLVGVLAAAGMAACGGNSTPTVVQQGNNAAAGGNGGGTGRDNTAFLDCLRSHGIAVPSAAPRPSGSRRARPSGQPRPRPSGSRSRRPGAFASVPADCASLRPSRGNNDGNGNPGAANSN